MTIRDQSTQITDLFMNNCMKLLNTQSALCDDFSKMKETSYSDVKEPLKVKNSPGPCPQVWEPPALNTDTHSSTVQFCDGDLVELRIQTSIGRDWCVTVLCKIRSS